MTEQTVELRAFASSFVPPRPHLPRGRDLARAGGGGFVGILLAAIVGKLVPGGPAALPFIIAPMGATAVLLFAVPASPLAQPYPVIGGNLLSTCVGIASAKLIDDPMWAATSAVAVAIVVMMLLGCVHPPGGACALYAAVGAPAVAAHGFLFALWPVGVNTLALVAMAIVVNNLTGRRYPHVPPPPPPPGAERPPLERVGIDTTDVAAAMRQLDEGMDIEPSDVIRLVRRAEANAIDRRLGDLRCGDVMHRDVTTVHPADSLFRARTLINRHHTKALPVVDDSGRVVGIVTMADLFNRDAAELATVESVMTRQLVTVVEETPVAELVGLMTDRHFRQIPVVTADHRLAGLVSRAELIAVLHHALLGGPGGPL